VNDGGNLERTPALGDFFYSSSTFFRHISAKILPNIRNLFVVTDRSKNQGGLKIPTGTYSSLPPFFSRLVIRSFQHILHKDKNTVMFRALPNGILTDRAYYSLAKYGLSIEKFQRKHFVNHQKN